MSRQVMNKEAASQTTATIMEIAPRINETIRELMMTGPSGRQFNEYRKLAGEVFGLLFAEFLHPIFREYPELEPPSWSNESTPPEQAIDRTVAEKIVVVMAQVQQFVNAIPAEDRATFEEAISDVNKAIASVKEFVRKSHADLVRDGVQG